MKFQPVYSFILTIFLVLCFVPNAFAQAGKSGMDLRMGLGANAMLLDVSTSVTGGDFLEVGGNSNGSWVAGPAGQISIGYRWSFFGIYIDQDLTGVWPTEESSAESGMFLGGTFVTARGIFPIFERLQLDLGIGLGVLYGAEEETKASLITDERGEPTAIFGLKGSLALTYYVTRSFGLGLHMDYLFGVNQYAFEQDIFSTTIKGEATFYYHSLVPGLHAMVRF